MLILGDREPIFHDDETELRKVLLEIIDLAIGPHPIGGITKTLNALHQHSPIPRPVEERRLPQGRHMPPEAPQIGPQPLLLIGCRRWVDTVEARVQRLPHPADCTTLAGRIISFKDQHEAALAEPLAADGFRHPLLKMTQLGAIGLFIRPRVHVEARQHRNKRQARHR